MKIKINKIQIITYLFVTLVFIITRNIFINYSTGFVLFLATSYSGYIVIEFFDKGLDFIKCYESENGKNTKNKIVVFTKLIAISFAVHFCSYTFAFFNFVTSFDYIFVFMIMALFAATLNFSIYRIYFKKS